MIRKLLVRYNLYMALVTQHTYAGLFAHDLPAALVELNVYTVLVIYYPYEALVTHYICKGSISFAVMMSVMAFICPATSWLEFGPHLIRDA